jgi:Ribbon-helix-helix protein, copG family
MTNFPSSDPRAVDDQRLSFTLPPDLDGQLRTFARDTERSLAAVVRLALRELLRPTGGALDTNPSARRP